MSAPNRTGLVTFESRNVWSKLSLFDAIFYIAGSITKSHCKTLFEKLENKTSTQYKKIVTDWLTSVKGHFALICELNENIVAATDRISSYQVFLAQSNSRWMIGTHAGQLAEAAELDLIDDDGLLSLSMAGYVTGKRSAIKNLSALQAGEVLIINRENCQRWYYHKFLPTAACQSEKDKQQIEHLSELTLSILDNVKQRTKGRQIVVPLSAGLDSRLILSGLKHLEAKDVITFSYGQPNNFEATTAQKIAGKLGVRWHFVPMSTASQRTFFQSSLYRDYLEYSHDFTATPFQQDLYPVSRLLSTGVIDKDAVIINGNSGDFISGGHIPENLFNGQTIAGEMLTDLINSFIKKHFSLWENRFSPSDYDQIRHMLTSDLTDEGLLNNKNYQGFILWERLEFLNRQSKYVISGQRIYDFLRINWELPLWSDEYLDFWSQVPLRLKINQNLYRKMLRRNNWGHVWKDIPVNEKIIRPIWLQPLRFAAKVACAPFGRNTWHQIEKRFFNYWMDPVHNYAILPYYSALFEKSLARNAISLHTDAYLDFLNAKISSPLDKKI